MYHNLKFYNLIIFKVDSHSSIRGDNKISNFLYLKIPFIRLRKFWRVFPFSLKIVWSFITLFICLFLFTFILAYVIFVFGVTLPIFNQDFAFLESSRPTGIRKYIKDISLGDKKYNAI